MSNYQYYEYQNTNTTNPYENPYAQTPPKKPKDKNGFGAKLAKAAAIGLVFGLVAGVTFEGASAVTSKVLNTDSKTPSIQTEKTTVKPLATSDGGNLDNTAVSTATTVTDVSDIVENVMPAVVQVSCMSVTEYRNWFGQIGEYQSESVGSGVIISQDDNNIYIASNNHVVADSKSLTVTFVDDAAVEGEVQGTDPNTDLAVVRVKVSDISSDTLSKIKVATLGKSDGIAVGESAIVIGNALGYGQSVTTGVISALNREVDLVTEDGTAIENHLIQTDAAVNPGNSGGALLNMNGEVVGIVSAKYADTEVEGMGYAIPISEADDILSNLMNGEAAKTSEGNKEGNGAYLGIAGVDVDSTTARQYDMPAGVYVSRIIPGGGAEAAGIQKEDVIVGFNGKKVSSMADIQKYLADLNPGDSVQVVFYRQTDGNYEEMTVKATLTEPINN